MVTAVAPLRKKQKEWIEEQVHASYWLRDINCANTTLSVLEELFAVELHPQVAAGAFALNAGRGRTQCGLVEGALLFIGIYGTQQHLPEKGIRQLGQSFATAFQESFGSLLCSSLRPAGFKAGNPPHLCEDLTKRAIAFAAEFIARELPQERAKSDWRRGKDD